MLKLRAIFTRKGGKSKGRGSEPNEAGVAAEPSHSRPHFAPNHDRHFFDITYDVASGVQQQEQPEQQHEQPLSACGVCGRTFSAAALSRHAAACERSHAAAAKRKVFDSHKQRTDLEQFISTPPASTTSKIKTPVLKKKSPVSGSQSLNGHKVGVGAGGGGGDCPHCRRFFNQRALDRHVEWCSGKSQRSLPAREGSAAVALQRLRARIGYKPPPPRNAFVAQPAAAARRMPQSPQSPRPPQLPQPPQPPQPLQPPQPPQPPQLPNPPRPRPVDYDPYTSAAAQMRSLMASQLDLSLSFEGVVAAAAATAPDASRTLPRTRLSPLARAGGAGGGKEKVGATSGVSVSGGKPRAKARGNGNRQRTPAAPMATQGKAVHLGDKYMKRPNVLRLDLFLEGEGAAVGEGGSSGSAGSASDDYIDPRLINCRDNLPGPPLDRDTDADTDLFSDDNSPAQFHSFTVQPKPRNSKATKDRKKKSSSIDSLSRQYDEAMASLESSIAIKLKRLEGDRDSDRNGNRIDRDSDLDDLLGDFDREFASCTRLRPTPAIAVASLDSRTADSSFKDSAYNSLRRSRRGADERERQREREPAPAAAACVDGVLPADPRVPRPRRQSSDSSTPSSTESGSAGGGDGAGGGGGGGGRGRWARFCHECGCGFPAPPSAAHFCPSCGVRRLLISLS